MKRWPDAVLSHHHLSRHFLILRCHGRTLICLRHVEDMNRPQAQIKRRPSRRRRTHHHHHSVHSSSSIVIVVSVSHKSIKGLFTISRRCHPIRVIVPTSTCGGFDDCYHGDSRNPNEKYFFHDHSSRHRPREEGGHIIPTIFGSTVGSACRITILRTDSFACPAAGRRGEGRQGGRRWWRYQKCQATQKHLR